MRTLLRGLFIGGPNDNTQMILRNYQIFLRSGLGFDTPVYNAIWQFIQTFVRSHNHPPTIATLRGHFEHSKEDEVTDQLVQLEAIPARTQGDYESYLNTKVEERRMRLWTEVLKEAGVITSTGMKVKDPDGNERVLQGAVQAAKYLVEKAHDIVAPTLGGRLSGEVTTDGKRVREEYERIKADPLAGIGQFSFIKQMDDALAGAKRCELWIHAAFTGHMKSTLMLNWAYNQAVIFRHNALIFSLEMPYEQCRRILYAIHSMHPKFREVRTALGIQRDKDSDLGLPYGDIRDGSLDKWHPQAERFYLDYVIPDFNGVRVVPEPAWDQKGAYGKIHIEVADPEKDDFTMADLRSMAETLYADTPFSMIFVDHAGLMASRRKRKSTTEEQNEVIRDLKKLALGFDRGKGMAVVGLFQINREGFKSALKVQEKTGKALYNLTHLSYANECEKSADIVTASWVDDQLRRDNRVQFQCLKSRDQKPFDPFVARVEWPCRRLLTCLDPTMSPEENERLGAEIDKAGQKLDV